VHRRPSASEQETPVLSSTGVILQKYPVSVYGIDIYNGICQEVNSEIYKPYLQKHFIMNAYVFDDKKCTQKWYEDDITDNRFNQITCNLLTGGIYAQLSGYAFRQIFHRNKTAPDTVFQQIFFLENKTTNCQFAFAASM
jgi:hypothetical protein